MHEPPIEQIKKNAALVIDELGKFTGGAFGLDRPSVEWVEGFIERQRAQPGFDAGAADGMISTIGCYLGEAIIDAAGGAWAYHEDGALGVRFTAGAWCFPFAKVAKQFESGREGGDSIVSFYDVAKDYVAAGKLSSERS